MQLRDAKLNKEAGTKTGRVGTEDTRTRMTMVHAVARRTNTSSGQPQQRRRPALPTRQSQEGRGSAASSNTQQTGGRQAVNRTHPESWCYQSKDCPRRAADHALRYPLTETLSGARGAEQL